MKKHIIQKIVVILIVLLLPSFQSIACTIFVLTDGNNTYFFNNEDNTNPNSRIWFVPAGKDHFGCGFVGYDDGVAQGGVNTEGLAFDWYAGKPVDYTPKDNLIPIEDSTSERMLETCSNVDEAIKFYKTYREPSFAGATIIIADKTGASVIIGARNSELYFEKVVESRVLGWATRTFNKMYNEQTTVNLESGAKILKRCMFPEEEGFNAGTKYSNSYNLKNGDMTFFNFKNDSKTTTVNLFDELEKGSHYYDMADLENQLKQSTKSLITTMNRLVLFDFSEEMEDESGVKPLIESIFIYGAKGQFPSKYFSERLRKEWNADKEETQSTIKTLGNLKSLHIIDKEQEDDLTTYSIVSVFENFRVLWSFELTEYGKLNDAKILSYTNN
ncbi:hypothetical protein [Psychroserpens sp. MEBiC05023]